MDSEDEFISGMSSEADMAAQDSAGSFGDGKHDRGAAYDQCRMTLEANIRQNSTMNPTSASTAKIETS